MKPCLKRDCLLVAYKQSKPGPREDFLLPLMFVLLLLQLNKKQSWKNSKVHLLLSTVTYKELLYRSYYLALPYIKFAQCVSSLMSCVPIPCMSIGMD